MPTLVRALADFRRCYDAMLVAADAVRQAVTVQSVAPDASLHTHPRVALIQHIVGAHFGYTVAKLRSRDRSGEIALARQCAMVLCREFTKVTLGRIGQAFRRDHGTVLHAVKAIADRRSVDRAFEVTFTALREQVRDAIDQARLNPFFVQETQTSKETKV